MMAKNREASRKQKRKQRQMERAHAPIKWSEDEASSWRKVPMDNLKFTATLRFADADAVDRIALDLEEFFRELAKKPYVGFDLFTKKERPSYQDLLGALERLVYCEAHYRGVHDLKGDGHLDTGRAWDKLRKAGDHARAIIAKVEAA